jgi:hypothetical protein
MNAAGVLIYITAVAMLLSNGARLFGKAEDEKSFIIPVFMLLLLVVSASITGFLVVGKPILLYLDGLKKEALTLLFYTIGWLALFVFLAAIILIIR